VQGGIVATMLAACIGVADAVKSGGLLAMPLAEMKTSFIRPALPGGEQLLARARPFTRQENGVHRGDSAQ